MSTFKKWFPVLAVLACSVPSFALITDEGTVTSSTTYTRTNAQHGMGSKYFGVHVYDNSGNRVQPSGSPGYSYTINASTYQLDITFTTTFSGTVKLIGGFSGLTSHSRDFAVSVGYDSYGGYMRVCDDCTLTNFALRSWSSKTWFTADKTSLRLSSTGGGGTWRAWLENSKVIFGYTGSSVPYGVAYCVGQPCEVRYSISDYPEGSIPLGSCARSSAVDEHWYGSVSDDRP